MPLGVLALVMTACWSLLSLTQVLFEKRPYSLKLDLPILCSLVMFDKILRYDLANPRCAEI